MTMQPLSHDSSLPPSSTAAARQTDADNPQRQSGPGVKRTGRRVLIGALVIAAALVGLFIMATLPRLRQRRQLTEAAIARANSLPQVVVSTARAEPGPEEQTLPGNSQAYRETALYARTTGYLKQWHVDLGDRVAAGQLIAEISAPDLDDQLAQAKANLEQARATLQLNEANASLAEIILQRYLATEKLNVGAVAQQQLDEQRATVVTSKASVLSARASVDFNEATVRMFTDLVSFERIVAPFAGVITARNVDPGALVTADSPSSSVELFHLLQTDPLRVFVDVPQTYSTGIKVGETAVVYRPEEPSKRFQGKVTRTANALDPNTRTLLTQIDVPNPYDELRPGMYLMVTFVADRAAPAILIPSAALVVGADGQQTVAILDAHNTAHYQKVQLGRDFGADIEIAAGLNGGERVIVHPGDALAEGQEVVPVAPGK